MIRRSRVKNSLRGPCEGGQFLGGNPPPRDAHENPPDGSVRKKGPLQAVGHVTEGPQSMLVTNPPLSSAFFIPTQADIHTSISGRVDAVSAICRATISSATP